MTLAMLNLVPHLLLQGMPAILDGERVSDAVTRYVPPFDEFEVRISHRSEPHILVVHAAP